MVGRVVVLIMLAAPMTFQRSAWFADTGFAAFAIVAALTVYGVWVAAFSRSTEQRAMR